MYTVSALVRTGFALDLAGWCTSAGRNVMADSTEIADSIRRRIASGELTPGERVPSTRQITRRWGVAMATATKVLTTLQREGLVVARPGIGTVVADGAPPVPAT